MDERSIFLTVRNETQNDRRAALLDQCCQGDSRLRGRVERLLRADGCSNCLLDDPILSLAGVDSSLIHAINSESQALLATRPVFPRELLGIAAPATRPGSIGRFGDFEILEILGSGGFGFVLRAEDSRTGTIVALKVISPHLVETPSARERFVREARAIAAVVHPHIVRALAVEDKPLPHLVMEFLSGETLQRRISSESRLPVALVCQIGSQIADALTAVHAAGFVHRDVKPENIMLLDIPAFPNAKLLDFGLARCVDEAGVTPKGFVLGTPLYMSPEQVKQAQLDHRSDLFSLGSVLYTMLAGTPPFRGPSILDTFRRIREETPVSLADVRPDLPADLCSCVHKLLARDPDDRIQSAAEARALLQNWSYEDESGNKVDQSRCDR